MYAIRSYYDRSGSQYVWLKSDNTIQANNGVGSIVIGDDGTVTINGVVTIDTQGNIVTPKDVQASTLHTDTASMTASGVSVITSYSIHYTKLYESNRMNCYHW